MKDNVMLFQEAAKKWNYSTLFPQNYGKHHIASVSWGKDSVDMLFEILHLGWPLHEVAFYDTGMEFAGLYAVRDKLLPMLNENNIKYTELRPNADFEWLMFEKPVNVGRENFHYGYSWCGGRCRWGTTEKLMAMDRYAESLNAIVYIGIAVDEVERTQKERKGYKILPLDILGITEAEALERCYEHGIDWMHNGVKLYDILDRVSCWCCGNKNLKELKNIYRFLPDVWSELKRLQGRTARPMKGEGKSVFQLEERFAAEIKAEEEKKKVEGEQLMFASFSA